MRAVFAPIWLYRPITRLAHWVNARLTPVGQVCAAATVAAIAFGIDANQSGTILVAGLLGSLLIVGAVMRPRKSPPLAIHRDLPRYATVNTPLSYSLTIQNCGDDNDLDRLVIDEALGPPLPTRSEYRAFCEPAGIDKRLDRLLGLRRWLRLLRFRRGAILPRIALANLDHRSAATVRVELVPLRRGYLRFAGTRIRLPDPLGLVCTNTLINAPASMLVLPERFPIPPIPVTGWRRHQHPGDNLVSQVGNSHEFLSLRDYQRGDSLRHVHWRSWARTGKPILKQYHDEYLSRQALIVDTCCREGPCFEAGLSLAASIVSGAHSVEGIVDLLLMASSALHLESGRARGHPTRMLECLACATATGTDTFAAFSDHVLQLAAQFASAIVILQDWDAKRRELIAKLRRCNLELLVVVLQTEDQPVPDAGPMKDSPRRFGVMHPHDLESGFRNLVARMPR